jgi:hypothetical protein
MPRCKRRKTEDKKETKNQRQVKKAECRKIRRRTKTGKLEERKGQSGAEAVRQSVCECPT